MLVQLFYSFQNIVAIASFPCSPLLFLKVPIVLKFFGGIEIRCMYSIHHLYLKLSPSTMKQFPYLPNVVFLLILGLYQVLYLKNLSPRVTERDLVSLFARFQEKKGPPIQFRMMTGRMRGQAFITFPSKQLHLDNYSVMAESLISSLATTYALSNLNIAYKRSTLEEGKRTQENMFFFSYSPFCVSSPSLTVHHHLTPLSSLFPNLALPTHCIKIYFPSAESNISSPSYNYIDY